MASGEGAVTENQDKELILYLHNYSFYSQKVIFVLNERCIKFKTIFINIAAGEQYRNSFLEINPRGEVPVLKDGDKIIPDSERIISYLEGDQFKSHKSLIPSEEGPEVIEKHNHFRKIINSVPADVVTIGSFFNPQFVGGPKMPFISPARKHMKNITEKAPAKLRDIANKEPKFADVLKEKADKLEHENKVMKSVDEYKKVLDSVDTVLQEIEDQLAKEGNEKWLISENFTLADIDLAILLERLYELGLEQRFWQNRPNISQFFTKIKQKESFKKSMPSALFHVKSLIGGIPSFLLSFV